MYLYVPGMMCEVLAGLVDVKFLQAGLVFDREKRCCRGNLLSRESIMKRRWKMQ
jgi:hypothetical protein